MAQNSSQGNELLLDRTLIPFIFLAIILLGNYGIFLGHNFLVGEVPYGMYSILKENLNSSGWRPDLGLGVSFFMLTRVACMFGLWFAGGMNFSQTDLLPTTFL